MNYFELLEMEQEIIEAAIAIIKHFCQSTKMNAYDKCDPGCRAESAAPEAMPRYLRQLGRGFS